MDKKWLIEDGGEGHTLGMMCFKVKCLEHFGLGVKYSWESLFLEENHLGLSPGMRKV